MGKSTPKPPNPYKVSDAQTQSNKETALFNAQLNRVDQSNPFGSISWSHTGDDPATGWSQTTNLSPELQSLLNSQIGTQQGISSAITGALGNLPTGAFNPGDINVDDVRQRSFDSQMALLAPQFEKGWTNLESTLSDRGIPIGAEIWNDQTGEFNRNRDTALLGASRTADLDARSAFNEEYGRKLNEYNLPFQTLGALMGNSQAVGNPQFSGVPQSQAAGTDVSGNIWNAYNAELQNAQNNSSNLMSGILGLGKLGVSAAQVPAIAAMFSDARLKRDAKRIGATEYGLPVYEFTYVWGGEPQVGVMAQEALLHRPEAVSVHPSGFLVVDYGLL